MATLSRLSLFGQRRRFKMLGPGKARVAAGLAPQHLEKVVLPDGTAGTFVDFTHIVAPPRLPPPVSEPPPRVLERRVRPLREVIVNFTPANLERLRSIERNKWRKTLGKDSPVEFFYRERYRER